MNLTDIFVNKLKIETKVVSIDSVFNDEAKVSRTQYAPPYQRNYVWDGEKATYFLESILIGTEIPPLIFFRSKKQAEIIDGRQRYETILRFLRGELRLSKAGLKKLDVLNIGKKTFGSLPDILKYDFLDTKLRTIDFSFHSREGLTQADEDLVKQEIFKRYNSGITPLKAIEIDKAIYIDDDLNTFFKEKLKEESFHARFNRLFRYEEKKEDVLLKKIRQLLVLHKIPIKYYSKSKQTITDKYYDLLSSRITSDQFDKILGSFNRKLNLLDEIREIVDSEETPYNRLISEVLFWAFSIMEDNEIELPKKGSEELTGFSTHILNNISAFKMDRSSFANQIVNRYGVIADYIEEVYGINKRLYIETGDNIKQIKREMNQSKENVTTNYQELRINKPEPSTYTIDDICRQMNRNRFLVRPPYQREEVINKRKSSEIIESLLLGIKLPPIFIFKNKDGISEVIDGQQRILSILAFLGREYMNERGEKVKSNKDRFSLQLRDSILKDLHGKCFDQLDEELREKITSFDLWVIEINERNNPDFEPLDLFIRLNNKPYPIKDDTFEMWNSYIDRGIIDTIKSSYKNSSGWFFMRKIGNRMDNENNYTVLSYFNYLDQNQQDDTEKGPFDIYKIGDRINFRLRSKGEISKILENAEKKDAFVEAVNHFEFSFISNLKTLLSVDKGANDKLLSKNLDEMMVVENNRRTQQSFYALWYFLKGLDSSSILNNRNETRRQIRELFVCMSSGITIEEFKKKVEVFRSQYKKKDFSHNLWCRLKDISEIVSLDDCVMDSDEFELYVKRDNRLYNRIKIEYEKPKETELYYGCKLNRMGFSKDYIAAVLQSSYIFKEHDFFNRNITTSGLGSISLPVLPMAIQSVFDRVMSYTQSHENLYNRFFESVVDRMVDEVFHQELFKYQNVSLFSEVEKLEDIRKLDIKEREAVIEKTYYGILDDQGQGQSGLMLALSAATGVSSSIDYEKDHKN